MQIRLQQFHCTNIEWFVVAVRNNEHSRSSLARGLCELERLARDDSQRSAADVMTEEEIHMLYFVALLYYEIIKVQPASRAPPDIRTFVVDLGRLAGFRPSKRQPLPGTKKTWQAMARLKSHTKAFLALREFESTKNSTESSVGE